MKKVMIPVIATLLLLVIMAQLGWLEIFGIHGIVNSSNKNGTKNNGVVNKFDLYTDKISGVGYRVKAEGNYFYIYENGDWKQLFMTGVNIGASEPGLFPGDLTISYDTYYRWFKYISEMNCNSIRVYTTMRPQFYTALNDYNSKAEKPLLLFQGVWMNEDSIERLSDVYAENEKILTEFKNDALQLVNVIHGNGTIPESPGKASGTYTADVSKWLGGWIVGIEWDPNFVIKTNEQHPDRATHDGEFLYTQSATPFESFLSQVGNAMIAYETENYKFQAPLAFTNWITTDPLTHPDDPHADEDKVTVNTENVKARNEFFPGMFIAYHIYPYYPDSLNYQRDYLLYKDETGKINTYRAYLADLKLAHTLPILVAEFGVPTSRGLGHESVMGYNQGRIDESVQGDIILDMFNSIFEEDYAGGLVFTWQDEWFKRTWNNVMFDIADRRPFWSNIQTTEQCFGFMAFDPGEGKSVCYVDGEVKDWVLQKPLVSTQSGDLYVQSDERYLYIMADTKNYDFNNDTLLIPINTIGGQGSSSSKDYNATFDKQADFIIVINGEKNSHIYVDSYYDAFYYYFIQSRTLSDFPLNETATVKNSGTFNKMLMCYGYRTKIQSTGEDIPDKAFETGKLQYGNGNPDSDNYKSLTDFSYKNGKLEIRIPWQLLNVMDPSERKQMDDFHETQVITASDYESFDFGFAIKKTPEQAVDISISGSYSYTAWNVPTWHERLKPAYYALQEGLKKYNAK